MRLAIDPYELTERIDEYYAKPGNSSGGSLHIVLDDGNVEGRNVLFCYNEARVRGDHDGMLLAEALLDYDYIERMDIIAGRYRRPTNGG